MIFSVRVAQWFYAVALIAWGIQHFMIGNFVAGRAPAWPAWLPFEIPFVFASGAILIVSGITIILNRKAKLAGFYAGTMILLWSGLRNCYQLISTLDYGTALVNTNKALTMGFAGFLVASTFKIDEASSLNRSIVDQLVEKLAPWTVYVIGFFLFASGIQHFIFADFVKFLVPEWIPGSVFWTYFAAVALIAGGLGLMIGIKRKLAATLSAWMVFTWFVVLHIPRALGPKGNANEWTAVFEALAVSGILFIISYKLTIQSSPSQLPASSSALSPWLVFFANHQTKR